MPTPRPRMSSAALPTSDPLLSALLKLLAILVQPGQVKAHEQRLVIPRREVQAAGLDEADVRALLMANCVMEWQGNREAESETSPEAELALTEDGLARIARRLGQPLLIAQSDGQDLKRPQWVLLQGGGGELRQGGKLLKRVRHDSLGQRRVLEGFEQVGWPRWVANPLLGGKGVNRKKVLRDIVRRLNEGQSPLRVRFRVHDGGACWEFVD
jgi:hypothetical protein